MSWRAKVIQHQQHGDTTIDNNTGTLGKWVPRAEPVIARDGAAFWVTAGINGRVVLAHWVLYPKGGKFQSLAGNDEGMCGFAVAFYQPINKPEAPNI